jgi:predicted nucleotidyltransferase
MPEVLSSSAIEEIMTSYVSKLREALGDNLVRVVLFGSCARGDHEIGSDIDVFVLVQDDNLEVKYLIDHLSDQVDWQYDTLICNIIRSTSYYNRYNIEPLYANIDKEGIVHYDEARKN